jgi:hypothetical protein
VSRRPPRSVQAFSVMLRTPATARVAERGIRRQRAACGARAVAVAARREERPRRRWAGATERPMRGRSTRRGGLTAYERQQHVAVEACAVERRKALELGGSRLKRRGGERGRSFRSFGRLSRALRAAPINSNDRY